MLLRLFQKLKFHFSEIFLNVELTYAQKLARLYIKFVKFFEVHATWKSVFFEFEIEGYGSFESFWYVCHGYDQSLTISTVISGSSSECVLLLALDEAVANTTFTLSVRSQIKQLRVKLAAFF